MPGKVDILKYDISSYVLLLSLVIIANCLCVTDNVACNFGLVELWGQRN